MNLEEAKAAARANKRIRDLHGNEVAFVLLPDGHEQWLYKDRDGDWGVAEYSDRVLFFLIDPEPEKEEECAKCKPLARCPECFAKLRSKSPARKTEGTSDWLRESSPTMKWASGEAGIIADLLCDPERTPLSDSELKEGVKVGLTNLGCALLEHARAQWKKDMQIPKPEPIELGEALIGCITAQSGTGVLRDFWIDHDRLLIARILEIVGERR